MPRRILVIVGHPDPNPGRLCRTLAAAYADGAERAGHDVRRIDVATLGFPMLRTQQEFEHGDIPKSLEEASQHIVWAEHLVFVFPLWLGTMPALLKAFHAARYGFRISGGRRFHQTLLAGRIVVTMGMPAFLYRLWFLGHGIAGMRRNILNFVGVRPVREALFGLAGADKARRASWIDRMRKLGERGA